MGGAEENGKKENAENQKFLVAFVCAQKFLLSAFCIMEKRKSGALVLPRRMDFWQ